MNSVGEILRTERVNQGRELAEIAEELCLTQSYLRAIERDDLKSLPGNSFYYKNFVKQYASILGVDQKRLQPGVEALVASEEPPPLPGKDPRYPVRQKPVPSEPSALRRLDPIVEDNNRRDRRRESRGAESFRHREHLALHHQRRQADFLGYPATQPD